MKEAQRLKLTPEFQVSVSTPNITVAEIVADTRNQAS